MRKKFIITLLLLCISQPGVGRVPFFDMPHSSNLRMMLDDLADEDEDMSYDTSYDQLCAQVHYPEQPRWRVVAGQVISSVISTYQRVRLFVLRQYAAIKALLISWHVEEKVV